MKKFVLSLFLSLSFIFAANAQDLESATNLYNAGAMALNDGNIAEALKNFESALDEAMVIGPEADQLKTNCEKQIPFLYNELGKEAVNTKLYDQALELFNKAIEKGNAFGDTDIVNEVNSVIPQVLFAKGNAQLNAKNYQGAIDEYKKVIELDPSNAMAYLRLGTCAFQINDEATALDALAKAADLGQDKNANKTASNYFVKKANAALKAKKMDEAISNAKKSVEYLPSPNGYKIWGSASMAAKKYDEAIAAYESYVAAVPNAKDINNSLFSLAQAYEAKGDKEKACGYYKQIMTVPGQIGEFATYQVKTALKCN